MSERIDTLRTLLQSNHRETFEQLQDLGEPELSVEVYQAEDGPWTAKDILGHLVDAEQGLYLQLGRLAKGDDPLPADFDVDRWNRRAVPRRRQLSYPELLTELESARRKILTLLNSTNESALDQTGRRPDMGELSLEALFRWVAGHRSHHVGDLLKALGRET